MLENPARHTSCSRCIPPIDFFLELVQPTICKQITDHLGTFIGITCAQNIQVIFRLVQLVAGFHKSFIRCFLWRVGRILHLPAPQDAGVIGQNRKAQPLVFYELLTIAQRNRSIVSLYRTEQDEDGEETGEDVTRDDSWNYAEILWNGIQAKAVTAAFEQLSYKEQWYLEKRNAICMTCGRVSPLSTQSTFEDLAVDFEGTTASGAKRFYRRTLDKLRLKLLESGVIHTVTLK